MFRVRSALPALTELGASELIVIDPVAGGGGGVEDSGGCCCGGNADTPPAQAESVNPKKSKIEKIAVDRSILRRLFPIALAHVLLQLIRVLP